MPRITGTYLTTVVGGENVRAFVPAALPPGNPVLFPCHLRGTECPRCPPYCLRGQRASHGSLANKLSFTKGAQLNRPCTPRPRYPNPVTSYPTRSNEVAGQRESRGSI